MEHTDEQLADIKAEFARRKRNQFIAAVPFIFVAIGLLFFEEQFESATSGISPAVGIGGSALLLLGIFAFSFRNWRCPACDRYLGRSTGMAHCPKCGVALK